MIHVEQATVAWSYSYDAIQQFAARNALPIHRIHSLCEEPPDGRLRYAIILPGDRRKELKRSAR